MKKLFIFPIFVSLLFSESVEFYVNGILNYKFSLDKFNQIYPPFYVEEVKPKEEVKKEVKKEQKVVTFAPKKVVKLKREFKVKLISILDGSAYIQIDEYLVDAIIDESKKWVKKGDKIGSCKVLKVGYADIYLRCGGKVIHKTLNYKIPIRDN